MIRAKGHWIFEGYRQRMTQRQWREILLREHDRIIFHGQIRRLKATNLDVGVVEVFKKPLRKEAENDSL